MFTPKVISRKKVFSHPWEKIYIERLKIDGGNCDYLISEPNEFVVIVSFVSDNEVVLVRQYKHGARKVLLGFPAGFIHKGETPELCAKRELLEETGYKAKELKLIASLFENPTRCRNKYHIIFANNILKEKNLLVNPDKMEGKIESFIVKIDDLTSKKYMSKILAGSQISAISFLLLRKQYDL